MDIDWHEYAIASLALLQIYPHNRDDQWEHDREVLVAKLEEAVDRSLTPVNCPKGAAQMKKSCSNCVFMHKYEDDNNHIIRICCVEPWEELCDGTYGLVEVSTFDAKDCLGFKRKTDAKRGER